MSNSPLISCTYISPNKNSPRKNSIDRITIHCVVGQLTAERIGEIFLNTSRQASCNYGIGKDGRIVLVVDEADRSWCSSSSENDNRAITIEVASDTNHPYAVTKEAFDSLLNLCTDICLRNHKRKLIWLAEKDKTLAYKPAPDEMILTVHRWFANKACPGEYLFLRQGSIAKEVTERLQKGDDDSMTQQQFNEMFKEAMHQYRKELQDNDASNWSQQARDFCVSEGIFAGGSTTSDGQPNYMWSDFITREQCAQILYRFAQKYGLSR